ncbi:MAG: 2-isopropylmalate synthase [bacterium]|nr:2-isopropylmalate synthase [bacterium]
MSKPPESENRVHIFDTTLRDGEQSPGVFFNPEDKLEIAQQLSRLGVDVIEAGFPINSRREFEGVKLVADTVEGPVIAGLARTQKRDIDEAWRAIRGSERPRIHTFISTSDIHIEHQLESTRQDVLGQVRAAVDQAARYCGEGGEVEFSPMDATRADIAFTAEACRVAIDNGADIINIPDTVGYTTPDEFAQYLEELYARAPELRDVRLSVHCHQDLGLAVANSYAGIVAGARQVECTVNGIGERAGNCSLEEIVMLLKTRQDRHGLHTGIVTEELVRTSHLVSRLSTYPVQPNKAVVGDNAFKHESGIHQDGVLKERTTYEVMNPADVGADPGKRIVLGKHSGKHAFNAALEKLGFPLEDAHSWFERFQETANAIGEVSEQALEAIINDEVRQARGSYKLVSFEASTSSEETRGATVLIRLPDDHTVEATVDSLDQNPDGAIDALFSSIREAVGNGYRLQKYEVRSLTEGEGALGEATVKLAHVDGLPTTGYGVATDVIEASARAYLDALSAIEREQAKASG